MDIFKQLALVVIDKSKQMKAVNGMTIMTYNNYVTYYIYMHICICMHPHFHQYTQTYTHVSVREREQEPKYA